MRNLLKSHCAYNAVNLMCALMDGSPDVRGNGAIDESVVRGAVLFVGMACWGAQKVQSLMFAFSQLLPPMVSALDRRSDIVDQEVLLSVNRLVSKYGPELSILDWDSVMEVLSKLGRHCYSANDRDFGVTWRLGDEMDTSGGAGNGGVLALYNSLLVATKALLSIGRSNAANAELDSLYRMVLDLVRGGFPTSGRSDYGTGGKPMAAQPSILSQGLITSMLEHFSASGLFDLGDPKALTLLVTVCQVFFVAEQRPRVRSQVLALVERLYSPSTGTLLLDRVLAPYFFSKLATETDPQIGASSLKLLGAVLDDGFGGSASDAHFQLLISTLFECASASATLAARASTILVSTLASCFEGRQPSRFVPMIFLQLVKFVGNVEVGPSTRLQALAILAKLGADNQHRVWLDGNATTGEHNAESGLSSPAKVGIRSLSSVVSYQKEDDLGQRPGAGTSPADETGEDDGNSDPSMKESQRLDQSGFLGPTDVLLPVSTYVDQMSSLLKSEKDWDVFVAMTDLLSKQLANFRLFEGCRAAINALRSALCETILGEQLAPLLSLPKNVRRADVYLQAYKLLTSLISYRSFFNKMGQDDMVLTFQLGLTKWPVTARPCVHSLLLCLHELPSSMTKLLPNTLVRMAQVISTTSLSVHILEFLSVLARMPALYGNFVEADFKRVFGIALHYIQHSSAVTSTTQAAAPNNYALGQFVIYLSYHVVTVWFMNLAFRERRRYVPFIIHYLALANGPGQVLDERIEVLIDMLLRYTYSNTHAKPQRSVLDEVLFDDPSASSQVSSRTWSQGGSLVTARSMKSLGWSEITVRRPSGIAKFLLRLENGLKGEEPDHARILASMAHLSLDSATDEALVRKIGPMLAGAHSAQDLAELRQTAADAGESTAAAAGAAAAAAKRHMRTQSSVSDSDVDKVQQQQQSEAEGLSNDATLRRTRSVNAAATASGKESEAAADGNVQADIASGDGSALPASALVKEAFGAESTVPDSGTANVASAGLAPYPFKDDALLDPGFLISQLSTYPDLKGHIEENVRILPDDDGTTRAIAVLDRIPVIDFHKIGVIYLGPGQTAEADILRNKKGSAAYHQFLSGLGKFNRLRDLREVYTGGLDTSQDLDGDYALFFEDEGSQIVFHVTTLMPNSETDPACTSKKRHIGNDYILIVFNESGSDYEFRAIPSQFNFVNFVVEPIQGGDNSSSSLFRVTMQRREDMPDFGPLADTKVVSAGCLSVLVRQLATHADTFAQIFYLNSSGAKADWISNWRERLRQIRRAKDRAAKQAQAKAQGEEEPMKLDQALDFTRFI